MAESMVAILQARVSSRRLRGKVLEPILGRPMLSRQIERLRRCRNLDRLVVATSDQPDDDALEGLCADEGISVFRGSLDDVLDRFYQCAREAGAKHVIRLTGDCPLADPELVDSLIEFYLMQDVDYASNCRPPTLPDGLDAEVFSFEALATAWREAIDPFGREHVVPYVIDRPQRFRIANWRWSGDASGMRWTVDEAADLEFVRQVYQALYPGKPAFGFHDVLDLLERHPELALINSGFERNEGSQRK